MAIEYIRKYIEANRGKYSIEVLVDELIKLGYPEEEIRACLAGKETVPGKTPASPATQISLPGKIGRWFLGLIIGGLGASVSSGFLMYMGSQFLGVVYRWANTIYFLGAILIINSAVLFWVFLRFKKNHPHLSYGIITALVGQIILGIMVIFLIIEISGF